MLAALPFLAFAQAEELPAPKQIFDAEQQVPPTDAQPAATEGREPHLVVLHAGAMQILDSDVKPIVGIDIRPGWRWKGFGPMLCVGGSQDAGVYGALGIFYDIRLGDRWYLTPSFGVGYFRDGDFTLGHDLEFRTNIELSRAFVCGHRLGVSFGHLSNGSISDINPGTESLCLTYAVPF